VEPGFPKLKYNQNSHLFEFSRQIQQSDKSNCGITIFMHQCYYCEQIFDSKEDLFQHSEIHSDSERSKENKDRQKKATKK
jgi:hypothetical protein